jgi:hypothetical protein
LIKILGEEVDAAIFVRFPKPPGGDWEAKDVELYSTANKALRLPIKEWSFMVLNRHDKVDNLGLCEYFAKSLDKQVIEVVKPAIIANCANTEEANTDILDRILDYLIQNIERLDRDYANFCYQELLRIHNAVSIEVEKARKALGVPSMMGDDVIEVPDFRPLFRNVWEQLTDKLEELLKELQQEGCRLQIAQVYADKIQEVETYCFDSRDDIIPKFSEIEKTRNTKGGYGAAYIIYLHKCRTHISRQFLKLDDGLEVLIDDVKSEVTNVFFAETGGMLGSLTDKKGTNFLKYMAENLPDTPSLQRIKEGFEIISNFNISYRNSFQHRIRKHLDTLTPDRTAGLNDKPTADEIQQKLQFFYDKAVSECVSELENFSSEPGDAAFGIVEEFVDQVLRSNNAEDGWEQIYYQARGQVWGNKFAEERKLNDIRKEWVNAVERVAANNNRESIEFID